MPLQRMRRTWTWKDSPSADEDDREFALTTASLADDGKRMGAKASLLDDQGRFADLFAVEIDVEPASNPTAGTVVSLYWGGSKSSTAGTNNPIGMSGSDLGWSVGDELLDDIWLLGNFKSIATTTLYTGILSSTTMPFPFGMPLIWNQLGVALTSAVVRITEIIG